jgi:hypothetical protein
MRINRHFLQQRLASMRRGLARASQRTAARTDRVIQDLEDLNRSTERDFLAVGGKLMEFRSTAHEIAQDIASITDLISGEEARRASETLAQLLGHGQEIDSGLAHSSQALSQLRDFAVRLRRGFSGLGNMVAVFGNLCTLTQIETARLGGAGAGLGHLAAEIRPLSQSIQESGERVLQASARLDAAVETALGTGVALRAAELKQMPALISGVLASLQAFEQQQRIAAETSRHQAAEYAALSQAIEELVGSIQFHDITRQQVEHVVRALRDFRGQGRTSGDSSPLAARAVLTLQSSQLREAARLFAASVARIEQALASLALRFRAASDEVQKLTGASAPGRSGISQAGRPMTDEASFFSRMEAQFAAVLKILETCAAAQTHMESTIAGLAETIGGMSASVAEIRRTEIQIQRISTNATIRAIHIGATGVALNKIAEVMQRLALESNTHTDEAAAALEGMRDIAARSTGRAQNAANSTGENPLVAKMRTALARLHSSSESSAARATHIGGLGRQLAQQITTLREGISAGRLFAEVAARAIQEMDSLAAEASPAAATRDHLEHFAQTYTMERQREVHASVVGTPPLPSAPAPKTVSAASDLGDNVELF